MQAVSWATHDSVCTQLADRQTDHFFAMINFKWASKVKPATVAMRLFTHGPFLGKLDLTLTIHNDICSLLPSQGVTDFLHTFIL